jgi:hypothetical protein
MDAGAALRQTAGEFRRPWISFVRASLPLAGLLSLLVAVLLTVPARAAAPQTYRGEAPVASQSEAERNEALKTALAGVVMEQTGDSGILARADVAAAVAEAPHYVLQYQYRRDPGDAGTPPRLVLVAEFDRTAVDAMLGRLGLGNSGVADGAAPDIPTEAAVWIGGVNSADDFARALAELGRLDVVRDAEPMRARGDGMLVHVSLTTDVAHFLDALAVNPAFAVVNGSPPVDGVDATLALAPR